MTVISFTGVTRLDLPADRILSEAVNADLESVIIAGWKKNGDSYFVSSAADGGDVLWLIEQFKIALLKIETR